jgi:hypothetical protein
MKQYSHLVKWAVVAVALLVVLRYSHARFYYSYPAIAHGCSQRSLLTNATIVAMAETNTYWPSGYEERLYLFPTLHIEGEEGQHWFPAMAPIGFASRRDVEAGVGFSIDDLQTTYAVLRVRLKGSGDRRSGMFLDRYQVWVTDGTMWYYAGGTMVRERAWAAADRGVRELDRRRVPGWVPLPKPTRIPIR